MIMLGMDGSNTNWSVLNKVNNQHSNENLPDLIELGSCGLHIIHGAFQTGIMASKWNLNKVMLSNV